MRKRKTVNMVALTVNRVGLEATIPHCVYTLLSQCSCTPPCTYVNETSHFVFVFLFPGDSCSPEMSLAARPGSLTVYINVSHSLVEEHGGHVKHRVYYGKEGESLEVRILVSLARLWNVPAVCLKKKKKVLCGHIISINCNFYCIMSQFDKRD